jgi:hypothetical protein
MSLSISDTGLQFNSNLSIGRDTITSAVLTTASWFSPTGLVAGAPIAYASYQNDLGNIDILNNFPTSMPFYDINYKTDWHDR